MAAARQTLGLFSRRFSLMSRSAVRTVRGHEEGNLPGENFPFQTKNKLRLFVTMLTVLGFGFSLPIGMTIFQMKKMASS